MNKPTQLATKSEVSQATAISDRPKVKAKNTRKIQQQQQQQQQQIQQSQTGVSLNHFFQTSNNYHIFIFSINQIQHLHQIKTSKNHLTKLQ